MSLVAKILSPSHVSLDLQASSKKRLFEQAGLLFENLDSVKAAHAAGKAIDPARAAENLPIPLHPGAERYYREIGVLK